MRQRAVSDIMTSGQVHTCTPADSVREASRVMAEHNVGSILVVEEGRLIGIFTERDVVRRVLGPALDPDATRVGDVMTRDPDTIAPGESVNDAIRRMDEFGYRHLPVVEGQDVVGVLSLRDCSIEDLAAMSAELERRHVIAERAW
jgi:CBS domain-containing protein